jgi:hypothetical protein
MAVSSRSWSFLPVVCRVGRADHEEEQEVPIMLSPHISSAFVQERQSRYRREATEQRLAGRRSRARRATVTTHRATADPRATRGAPRPTPSPAH